MDARLKGKEKAMILIVTPNPALDRTIVVPDLRPGQRHRVQQVLVAAGGKGLNVARTAQALNLDYCVTAPLGGLTGQMVAHLAEQEGLKCCWSWHSAGETRTCIIVVDPSASDATPLDEHGPLLSLADWLTFVDIVEEQARFASIVVIAGSLPPGVEPAVLGDLVRALEKPGCRTIVDTSGAALMAALGAVPFGIKVNGDELSNVLSTPVQEVHQAVPALARLRARGITLAVVSLGEQGAVAAGKEGVCWAAPPPIELVSTVGSGDAMMAGLTMGLSRKYSLDEILRLGVACGAANALTMGGGSMASSEVQTIAEATTITWLGQSS